MLEIRVERVKLSEKWTCDSHISCSPGSSQITQGNRRVLLISFSVDSKEELKCEINILWSLFEVWAEWALHLKNVNQTDRESSS